MAAQRTAQPLASGQALRQLRYLCCYEKLVGVDTRFEDHPARSVEGSQETDRIEQRFQMECDCDNPGCESKPSDESRRRMAIRLIETYQDLLQSELKRYHALGRFYHKLALLVKAKTATAAGCGLAHEQFAQVQANWMKDPWFAGYSEAKHLLAEAKTLLLATDESSQMQRQTGKITRAGWYVQLFKDMNNHLEQAVGRMGRLDRKMKLREGAERGALPLRKRPFVARASTRTRSTSPLAREIILEDRGGLEIAVTSSASALLRSKRTELLQRGRKSAGQRLREHRERLIQRLLETRWSQRVELPGSYQC